MLQPVAAWRRVFTSGTCFYGGATCSFVGMSCAAQCSPAEALPAVKSASSLTPVHQLSASAGGDNFPAAADTADTAHSSSAVQMTNKSEDPPELVTVLAAQAAAYNLAGHLHSRPCKSQPPSGFLPSTASHTP